MKFYIIFSFVRYELEKIRRGRDLITEKISPLRFLGYVFIKDMLNRKTYTFTVFDIMQVNGLWYGGELAHIYKASTKDEYAKELAAEKKRLHDKELGIVDTSDLAKENSSSDEEEEQKMPKMKEIMDRKFYKGKFDNEISVQLYIRHIKGGCPEIICAWDALFKFGDQDEWVKLQHYQEADIEELLLLWKGLNRQLARVISQIPEENLKRTCDTGKTQEELHTIEFLIDDYITHLRHHLFQIR